MDYSCSVLGINTNFRQSDQVLAFKKTVATYLISNLVAARDCKYIEQILGLSASLG